MKIDNFKMVGGGILALFLQNAALADTGMITDLYSTGVNTNGSLVSANQADPNYSYISPPAGVTTGPLVLPNSAVTMFSYVPNTSGSQWIGPDVFSPSNHEEDPPGLYMYKTTFTIPSYAILSSVDIVGMIAVDDANSPLTQILLNGVPITGFVGTSVGFSSFSSFTIDLAMDSNLSDGPNTLEFDVENHVPGAGHQNPTGLQVDFTNQSFTVPAPALNGAPFLPAMGLALLSWGLLSRRKNV